MNKIAVLDLLKKYKNWMEKGEIQFLQKEKSEYKNVSENIDKLIIAFDTASKAKSGDLSDNLDLHNVHKIGKEIWCDLISSSLINIDPTAKGNSKLYKFMEKATEFEDLLYGLEDYYRDHTLHALWVYFIGEYIMREKLQKLHNNLTWYLYNDIEKGDNLYSDALRIFKRINKQVNEMRDAIWCLIALCHDLGYSLSKLNGLNEKVKGVLSFFDLDRFSQVGYSLNIEHQYNMSQFLELIAMEVRIVPDKDGEEAQIKCYREDSTYWRLCRALEKKQHGILSAYLIYKVLGIFADFWLRGTAEEWGLDKRSRCKNCFRIIRSCRY